MKPIPSLLSKTKLLRGYRCPKCIYLTIHQPELEAAITPETQALFDQGNQVGVKARDYFPGGVLIDNAPWDFLGAVTATQEKIASGAKIIYEAAFIYQGCYARADIICYSDESKRWSVFEVKSSTKLKPEHIDDVGLQVWIMTKSSLPIEKISLLHLNPDCRYPDLSHLFKEEELTERIRATYLSIKPKIHEIFRTIRDNKTPDSDIGPYCLAPTACGFVSHCWQEKKIPPMSIFNLPGLHHKKWSLYAEGIISLDDTRLTDMNALQQRIIAAHHSGQRYLDAPAIKKAFANWQFPLVFLDFETINPAIPRYDGCGPFMQVPFQFSVHILEHIHAQPIHHAFLHETAEDPRPHLIPALLKACGEHGSIVAYYGKFEAERIQELAAYSPAHATLLQALVHRIVDPLPIIREHIYDPAFAGSFSLKNVAPALLGQAASYKNMPIGNGGDAQRGFEKLISPLTSSANKEHLKKNMLAYCEKDTEVMVQLIKWLYDLV